MAKLKTQQTGESVEAFLNKVEDINKGVFEEMIRASVKFLRNS